MEYYIQIKKDKSPQKSTRIICLLIALAPFDLNTMRELMNKKSTEPFHFISKKLDDFYDNKNNSATNKMIRSFLTDHSLSTYLKIILMTSKAFKDDKQLLKK